MLITAAKFLMHKTGTNEAMGVGNAKVTLQGRGRNRRGATSSVRGVPSKAVTRGAASCSGGQGRLPLEPPDMEEVKIIFCIGLRIGVPTQFNTKYWRIVID